MIFKKLSKELGCLSTTDLPASPAGIMLAGRRLGKAFCGRQWQEGAVVRIAGVVLAGGRSRRMGRDKSLLRLGGDTAPTLLERSVALLRPLCEQVWVSCRAGQTYARQTCVPDLLPASGPICGVHAALVRARAEGIPAVLALSCDLPLMHTGMLRRLVAAFAASPRQSLMTAFMAPNGWTESLAAIYRVEAAPFLEAAVARGNLKMREAVPLELQCFEKYGAEDARAFFNVNTPQDLQQAATALGGTIAQETGEKFAEIPDRA